jgi:hypothetical protein
LAAMYRDMQKSWLETSVKAVRNVEEMRRLYDPAHFTHQVGGTEERGPSVACQCISATQRCDLLMGVECSSTYSPAVSLLLG